MKGVFRVESLSSRLENVGLLMTVRALSYLSFVHSTHYILLRFVPFLYFVCGFTSSSTLAW